MEVLLSHGYFLEDDEKEQRILRPYPPLGILCIAAYLDEHGIANSVYDTTFSSKPHFNQYLLQHQPPVLALYVNLMTKINILETIRFVKQNKPATRVVLGGPEVKHSAENFLRAGADVIVIGEGEETTAELVAAFKAHGYADGAYRHTIRGIAFLDEDRFVETPERDKIKDINTLPVPARHKIDLDLYLNAWKQRHGTSALSVSTMRGCPYTCKWCSRAVYGLSYRRRSPEKVADELDTIRQRYQPDSVWFVDDVFTISHKWLTGFRDALKERNFVMPYECITRADRMNEEVIGLLKDTGCFRVWIGAESGSQHVIDLMDRRVQVTQVRDMIKLTKTYGIETGTFIMLGYPGETEADIEQTITHLKESDPDHFTITIAYPIRGTELFEEVEALQTTALDWNTSTDRDIDFKRSYPRKFYDFAVRRVVNEVLYSKRKHTALSPRAIAFKLKSVAAKVGMWWTKGMASPEAKSL
ncbi:B12-binding domain-containing radical SAM protein [Chryseolinea lacunae]|uniref:B12-binding domain-containing radical SAM protein n=1 Tax=Chryseolinea lacunae TaxID=2801331 RepID=A0ABS1KS54_9BACT|nr:radical SAM protein [Chryseolinea lacunae]MBL0742269.1 B12-binding domain-containing radical SAM protein [Chryseolinea lacunae]